MSAANGGLLGPIETDGARSLLDQLLTDSRLYTKSKHYKQLLDFVVHLRNFAPFNAMLLQVQKPGLRYAASAHDWRVRFGRTPIEGARPMLILWPFGPVALVYDDGHSARASHQGPRAIRQTLTTVPVRITTSVV
jgi:hypothetical protein